MRELFIQESDDKKVKMTGPVTLIVALVFLLIFAGCSAASGTDGAAAWGTVTFTMDKSMRYTPSIAIWAVDENGATATLYATKKAAGNTLDNRPGALPVWNASKKNAAKDDLDTVSGATPSGAEASIGISLPESFKGKKIRLYIEANSSYDYNDTFKEGLKSGDAGYSDVNGQPSVVWEASADLTAAPSGTLSPTIAGHGDVLGASGGMNSDMTGVTTAQTLLSDIKIEYGK